MRDGLAAPERAGVPGSERPVADVGQAGGRVEIGAAEIIVHRAAKSYGRQRYNRRGVHS
jgi:hypothetical protein